MAAQANWYSGNAVRAGSTPPRDANQQPVEALIRRLIERVEESAVHYSEALDELHGRLDQLSQTTEALPTSGTAEETETLERLRRHLTSLTDRLEQPKPSDPGFNEFAKLDKALAEARDATASFESGHASNAQPLAQSALPFPSESGSFKFTFPTAEPLAKPQTVEAQAAPDLDQRLVEMANRLERSIADMNAKSSIEALNARMDELAKRFEGALAQAPGQANFGALEKQISEIGPQVGRLEQQLGRITGVERELNRLIERFDGTPAHIAEAASRAANEAARLVAESAGNNMSAVERLDAIHRDLVAMNERSRATDDRVVDTLAAVHDSLKGLATQIERGNRANVQEPKSPLPTQAAPELSARSGITPASQHPGVPPFVPESAGGKSEPAPDGVPTDNAVHNRLRELDEDLADQEARALRRRPIFEEPDLEQDELGPQAFAKPSARRPERDSIDDLVAAARRASQAAAMRAEGRGAFATRPMRGGRKAFSSPLGAEMPERRKRSVLMIAAALLLVVSAALLYSRLRDKLETEPVPPVATDIAPDLSAAPPPAPRPNTTPGAAHTPDAGPHATSPSSLPAPVETAPVVRVTEADQSSGWDTWITDQTGATRERISGIRPQHRD